MKKKYVRNAIAIIAVLYCVTVITWFSAEIFLPNLSAYNGFYLCGKISLIVFFIGLPEFILDNILLISDSGVKQTFPPKIIKWRDVSKIRTAGVKGLKFSRHLIIESDSQSIRLKFYVYSNPSELISYIESRLPWLEKDALKIFPAVYDR